MPKRRREKISYEFDPHNRLIAKSELLGIRKVLEGQFKVDKYNNLIYEIKTPIPSDIKAPHQVKLKGNWSLDDEHNLRFVLDKWQRRTFGEQITLQGEILDVKNNALLFGVTSRNQKGNLSLYALELSGNWQADEHNRLTFKVNKEKDKFDILTFVVDWQIDKNYQITYTYEKKDLLRKEKRRHTFVFKGHWDILDNKRITYVIEKSNDSIFNFKTSSGIFRQNYIKYELGIGLARRRRRRSIIFFGQWRIKEGQGFIFEIEKEKKIQAFVFGAEAKWGKNNNLIFSLRNRLNQDMESKLQLSRDILKEKGQLFLRLLKSKKEFTIEAGAGFCW